MRIPARIAAGFLALATVLAATPVAAQQAPAAAPPAADKARAAPKKGPQRVIEMEALEVIGKVQKPHVFYVIERGDLKYRGLPLDRSLLKEVEDSVNRPPF
jgi:DMSO/TMAO reductase YedYZ molybdopterin-dependent catalytic subunit